MKILSFSCTGLKVQADATDYLHKVVRQQKADFVCLQNILRKKVVRDMTQADPYSFAEYSGLWETPGEAVGGCGLLRKSSSPAVNLPLSKKVSDNVGILQGHVVAMKSDVAWIVSVSVPMTFEGNRYGSVAYREKREEFDKALLEFVKQLDAELPVILCGDMFCTASDRDIEDKNMGLYGRRESERENITALMNAGFKDALRIKNPDFEKEYTWWNTNADMEQNRGARLDYIFVSDRIADKVKNFEHHKDILSSTQDIHCAITMEIDL